MSKQDLFDSCFDLVIQFAGMSILLLSIIVILASTVTDAAR